MDTYSLSPTIVISSIGSLLWRTISTHAESTETNDTVHIWQHCYKGDQKRANILHTQNDVRFTTYQKIKINVKRRNISRILSYAEYCCKVGSTHGDRSYKLSIRACPSKTLRSDGLHWNNDLERYFLMMICRQHACQSSVLVAAPRHIVNVNSCKLWLRKTTEWHHTLPVYWLWKPRLVWWSLPNNE